MKEAPPRQLARDTSTGRDGEIMARTTTGRYERVWMRPVGGGREWDVPREFVQLLDDAEGAA